MMTPKRSLFLFLVLAAFCWLVFSSLHPSVETYIIEGQVRVLDGAADNTRVYFTQEEAPPEPEAFDNLNKAVVQSSGAFNTRFNAIPNKLAYVYVVKEGYTTVRSEVMLAGPGQRIQLREPLEITSLPYSRPFNDFVAEKEQLEVIAYEDACLDNEWLRAPIDKVNFFEKVSFSAGYCQAGLTRDVFRANLCIDKKLYRTPSFVSVIRVP